MGFDQNFIPGFEIPLPILGRRTESSAFNNGTPIDHTYFSIVFNQDRGLATYTAHNIDGATIIPEGTIDRNDRFDYDPEVPEELQVNNERGYRNNPWDRGHLVRRRSLHWGDQEIARAADRESFYWTNIAPQHNRLHQTAWGKIERWMMRYADDSNQKVAVFTGPVFTDDDVEHQNRPDREPIKIPAGFWKIMAIQHEGRKRAVAFLVWQRDFDREGPVSFEPILEQVRITTIEFLVGLSFGDLRNADPLRYGTEVTSRSVGDRSPRSELSNTPPTNTSAINGPEDILI